MKPGFSTVAMLTLLASLASARAAVPEFLPEYGGVTSLNAALDAENRENLSAPFQMVQDFVPLESVLADLRSQYSGHQLSVSGPSRTGDGYVYRIKWLTEDGAVLYVVADAETGEILSVEGE